jgi:hypothetical protein
MFDMLEVSKASLGAHVGNVCAVRSMTRLVVVTVKQTSHIVSAALLQVQDWAWDDRK